MANEWWWHSFWKLICTLRTMNINYHSIFLNTKLAETCNWIILITVANEKKQLHRVNCKECFNFEQN